MRLITNVVYRKMMKVEEIKEENTDIDTIFLHAVFWSKKDPLEM